MMLPGIVIIVLGVLIIVALAMLCITRKRLKEMDGLKAIKDPGKDDDEDDVIDSFGE